MELKKVLIKLNALKKVGIIQDYAIGGGYAVMFYDAQLSTYDLDVIVLLSSEDDFHKLYDYFRSKKAKIENVYIFIEDMPVQFLPSYISPLFYHAIKEASEVHFNDVNSKFVSAEYLILLLLTAFREKDKIRIRTLLDRVNRDTVLGLIKRFDNEKKLLSKRYKRILAHS